MLLLRNDPLRGFLKALLRLIGASQHDHAAAKPHALGSITLKAQCGPVAALLCVLSSGRSQITPLSRNPDAEHPLA